MTHSIVPTRRAMFAAVFLSALAAAAGAQATDVRTAPSLVRVTVADAVGGGVANAEVTLMLGLRTVIAQGSTNADGVHEFVVNLDSTDYSVVVRKEGYDRGDRFFAARRTSVDVAVTLHRAEPASDEQPDDAQLRRQRSYNIAADEISAADVPLESALDVVVRLRPDIVTSRSGTWGGDSRFGCPMIENVWVNDYRYVSSFATPSLNVAMRAKGHGNRAARLGAGNMTFLSEIAPEHIEAIGYRDCFDSTESRLGMTNALFITLKDGVGYRPGRGTFVMDDTGPKVVRKE